MSEVCSSLFSASARVQRGDLWHLGRHRLLCGDSANTEDVARLFHGKRFALCFTSPPYGNQRTYGRATCDWHTMMCDAFDQIIAYSETNGHILINLGLSHAKRQVNLYWLPWLLHCADVGWPLFGWYVWDKLNGLPGENQGRLMPSHEFVFHFNHHRREANKWIATQQVPARIGKQALRQPNGSVRKAESLDKYGQPFKVPDSVIRLNPEKRRGIHTQGHPAVFPVAFPEFIMKTWSQPDDVIYEPFCGSGTSIIAAENLQRHCYAMEIDEAYCRLIIERFVRHTGKQAVKEVA